MITAMYSDCHLAEVMDEPFQTCSWCGNICQSVNLSCGVGYDIELTLRRWKEGDCSTEDMFKRLITELERQKMEVSAPVRKKLQVGSPKFGYSFSELRWVEGLEARSNNNGSEERQGDDAKPSESINNTKEEV